MYILQLVHNVFSAVPQFLFAFVRVKHTQTHKQTCEKKVCPDRSVVYVVVYVHIKMLELVHTTFYGLISRRLCIFDYLRKSIESVWERVNPEEMGCCNKKFLNRTYISIASYLSNSTPISYMYMYVLYYVCMLSMNERTEL